MTTTIAVLGTGIMGAADAVAGAALTMRLDAAAVHEDK